MTTQSCAESAEPRASVAVGRATRALGKFQNAAATGRRLSPRILVVAGANAAAGDLVIAAGRIEVGAIGDGGIYAAADAKIPRFLMPTAVGQREDGCQQQAVLDGHRLGLGLVIAWGYKAKEYITNW